MVGDQAAHHARRIPHPATISTSNWMTYIHQLNNPMFDSNDAEEEICHILGQVSELRDATAKERFAVCAH
jgi:hypothetical protein